MLHTFLLPLILAPVGPNAIKVDAYFGEWDTRKVMTLSHTVKGADDPADLSGRIQFAWSPKHLYFAAQVVDNVFVFGDGKRGDRLSFNYGTQPDVHRVEVILRDLEDTPPLIEVDGKKVRTPVVGTYRKDGWAVEGRIPLRSLPGLVGTPIPFAAVVHDADRNRDTESIRATSEVTSEGIPTQVTLHLGAAAGLEERARQEQAILPTLKKLTGNLVGSAALPEDVIITEQKILVLGHGLPERMGYTFATHGWRDGVEITEARLENLDGRPGKELFVVHREWSVPGETQVELTEIWGLRGTQFRCLFAQKTGEWLPKRGHTAQSKFEIVGKGKRARILKVHPATVSGFNQGNYLDVDPPNMPYGPLLLPWQAKKPQKFRLKGGTWQ